MTWRDFYPNLVDKKSKEACLAFSLECFKQGASHTNDAFVHETAALVESDLEAAKKRIQQICITRATTKDKKAMEAAHIVIHLIEVAKSNSTVSAAGHAARCGEALYRIDPTNEVLRG